MDFIILFFTTFANATIANPTFLKEFGLLIAAAAIMKPIFTKSIENGIEKGAENSRLYTTQMVNKVSDAMNNLTRELHESNANTIKNFEAGNRRFFEIESRQERHEIILTNVQQDVSELLADLKEKKNAADDTSL